MVYIPLRNGDRGAKESDQAGFDGGQSVAEPEAHVSGHLIVTGAASVELAGDVGADNLAQAALVGSVNVFV
jgi:hypothetical protein